MFSTPRFKRCRLAQAIALICIAAPLGGFAAEALAQNVDLGNLGGRGFGIEGIDAGDRSGSSVSGAGDVNGDGLADLIVGAPVADPSGRSNAGESYVVFGKANSSPIDLAALGAGGFLINGIDAGDYSGFSVSAAGDVNGDGLADLIVGAGSADPGGISAAGESYVVFGKTDSMTVDLAALGTGGFRIDGIDADDRSGVSVSGAGDVNGDGLADLIVGAPYADRGGASLSGESYVVFGKADPTPVGLATLGAGGFRIDGIDLGDRSGGSVSGAGDVNGDGLADLIVGAGSADPGGDVSAGESYVVFGKASSTSVDLAALGTGGFRIDGIDAGDSSGVSVSGAGDVNGDGLADLIVGAYRADAGGDVDAGESYVVFGKASSTPVDLAMLGVGGFRIDGIDAGDRSGVSVSGAGDVNGDGLADLVIGASRGASGGAAEAGESYVVFSGSAPPPAAAVRARSADGDPPRTAFGITGDGTNDSTPDARAWIDFADGDDLLLAASTEIVTLNRGVTAFPSPAAAISWRLQTTRQDWTTAELRLRYLDRELLIGNENALQIVFSPNGSAPFTPLPSVVNPLDNTISANITQAGFFFIGQRELPPLIFADGFE
jgi:hypothetical protein